MSDDILNLIPFHPFKTSSSTISKDNRYNAIDSHSGIIVSVADKGLYFYDTNAYEELSFSSNIRRDKLINVDNILKINIDSEISWAEFNCSGSYLLIAIISDTNLLTKINIIDVQKTINEKKECIVCYFESNGMYKLQDVKWHPIDECSVLVVMNNIVHLCIIKGNSFVVTCSQANAFCVSWSPKGKQFLVVMKKEGSNNFFLNQYDIMMVEKRSTEIMNINDEFKVDFDLIPIEACWYSTYHCIIGFRGNTRGNEQFKIFVCNVAIKTNTIQVLSDVGSSSDCINPNPGPCARLYYTHILEWNTIILVNNSSENAVIYEYDNESNLQVLQTYCLPVDGNVIGLTCDFSSNKQLPESWLSSDIKQSKYSSPILFLKLSNSDCFGIYLQHSQKKITTTNKISFNANISTEQSQNQLTNRDSNTIFNSNENKSNLFGLSPIKDKSATDQELNTGNLFGNLDQNKPKSNLFGNQTKDETATTNLFGIQKQEKTSNEEKSTGNIFGNQGQSSSNLFGNQNKEKTAASNLFGPSNQGQSTSNLFGNQDKSTTQNQGQSNIFGIQNKEKIATTKNQEKTLNHEKSVFNIFGSQNQDKNIPFGAPNQLAQNQGTPISSNMYNIHTKGKFNEKSILSGDENQDNKSGSSNKEHLKNETQSPLLNTISGKGKEKQTEILSNLQKLGSGDHEKSGSDKKKDHTLSRQVHSATKSNQNKVDMIDNFLPDAIKCLEKRMNEIKLNTTNYIKISRKLLNDDKINKEISSMFRDIEQHYLDLDKIDKENKNLIDKSKTLFQDIAITLEFTTRFQGAIAESKIKNKQFKPSTNPLLKKISLNLDELLKKVDNHLKDLEDALDYAESKRNEKSKINHETIQSENIDHLLRSNFKCIKVERSKIDLLNKHLNDSLSLSDDLLQLNITNFQSRFSNLEMEKYLHSLMCKRPVINLSCKLSEIKPPISIEKKVIKTPSKHSVTNRKSNEPIKTEPVKLISATPPKPVTMKLVDRNSYKINTPNSPSESVTLTDKTKPIQSSNSYPEMLSKENSQINTSSSFVHKDKNIQSSGIKDEIGIKSTELINNSSKCNESIFSNKSISTEPNTLKLQSAFLTPNNLFKSQDPETIKPISNLVENLPTKSGNSEDLLFSKTQKSFTTLTSNNQITGSSTNPTAISSTVPGNSETPKSSDIFQTSNKTNRDNETIITSSKVTSTEIKSESIVNTTQLPTSSISPSTTKSSSTSNLVNPSTIQSSKSNSGLFGSIAETSNNLLGSTISPVVASTSSISSLSAINSTSNTAQPRLFEKSSTENQSNTNTKSTAASQFKFTDNSNTLTESNTLTGSAKTSTTTPSNSNNPTQSNSLFGSPFTNVQSSGGLFGSTKQNSTPLFGSPVAAQSSNLFVNSNTTAQGGTGLFGTPTKSSVNPQSAGIFSTPTTVTNQSAGGIFGNSNLASSNKTSLFGSSDNSSTKSEGFETNSPNKTNSGLFGNTSFGNHNTSAKFGSQTTSTQQSTLFGSDNQSNQTNTGLFGNHKQSAGGFFDSPKSSVTAPPSSELFSTPTQNKSNAGVGSGGGGLFGNSSSSSQNNQFGSNTNTNTQSTGLFGQTSTKSNLFGSSVQTVGGSLFGSSTTTTTQSSGLFGNQSVNNNTTSGLFGNSSSSTTTTGFFGKNAPSPNAGLFASPGQINQQTSTALFGTPTNQTSIFSSNNPKPDDSISGISFGGSSFISGLGTQSSSNTKNIFAPENIGGSSSSTTNLFSKNQSSTPGNLFSNSSSSNSGSLFGNNSPATSQTPPSSSSSLFGSRPVFGSTNQNNAQTGGLFSNSVFGNSSDNQMTFGDMATNNQSQSGFGMMNNNTNQPGNIFQTTTSPSFTQRRM